MRNKMLIILGIIVVLFAALYFVVDYKNKQTIEKHDNPYGKSQLAQETIDQLDDPLYQNQIIPSDLDKKLEKKEDVVVYFYSPTCPHCKKATPQIVPIAEKMGIDMKKVNLLEFSDDTYWKRYFIQSTPTLVQYKDGVEEARIEGSGHSDAEYKAFFNQFKKYHSQK